jgi:hypothetical protein
MSVIPALRRWRQEDPKFQASLCNMGNVVRPVSNTKKKTLFIFFVLGIKPRALSMLGRHSTTDLISFYF